MFCNQPFNHIDVIVENDQIILQPCNVWKMSKKYSIQEYKENISSIQNILKDNFHNGCTICKNEENLNIRSRRQALNQFGKDNQLATDRIQSLGVRYGTLCNSKCMICSHTRSSLWVVDSEKLGYTVKEQYRFKKNLLPGVDIFFDNFDLDDLRYVEFHGGEPLMQSYPYDFLKKIKKLDQLIVKFNTNLTVLPTEELNELLKKCKRVDVLISVDDIEERYEILRYPGKWKLFLENIQKIKQQGYRLMSYNVISSLNLLYVPEFYNWAIKNFSMEVHSQLAVDKKILDISYLPHYAKEYVLEKLDGYTGKTFTSIKNKLNITQQGNEQVVKNLRKYILDLDNIRKTNYTETFKEWWKVIN